MEYKINNQLLWLSELFEKNNVRWILDSGSLLSIIREGKFFKGDDIDISVLREDREKVLGLKKNFENKGFIFAPRLKKNGISSVAIWTKKESKFDLPIDLKFFYKKSNIRWSPSVYSKNATNKGMKHLLNIAIKMPFYFIHRLFPLESKSYDIWRKSFNFFFSGQGYWSVPADFMENTIFLEDTMIRIPKDYKKYLEFRYGKNWKTPIKKWNYTRSDGAIILENPFKKNKKIKLKNQ